MKSLKQNGSETLVIKNKSVSALMFDAYAIAAATNTAFATNVIDWSQLQVKAVLKQNGKETTLLNTDAQKLAFTNILNSQFNQRFGGEMITQSFGYGLQILEAAAVGVKEKVLVPFKYDLGEVINLKGDDSIVVDFSAKTIFPVACDSTLSEVRLDYEEGIGVQFSTPKLEVINITDDVTDFSVDLGDGVTQIIQMNTDKSGVLTADLITEDVTIECDKWSNRDRYFQLLNKRLGMFTSVLSSSECAQSFLHYSGIELNAVNFKATLNTANVNSGCNYLLVRRNVWSLEQAEKGVEMRVKHQLKNEMQLIKKG